MCSQISRLTTKDIIDQFRNQGSKLIDVRSADAYNGWKLQNELRGGHIEGARNLPIKWTTFIDWIEIVRSKGILPHDPLILYGYEENKTDIVARQFVKAGYQNVSTYHEFLDEWCANTDLPMEHLARYRQLVSAEWLNELISNGVTTEFDNNKYILCHAHYRNRSDYEEVHIPGAVDLDTNSLESPETWNRRTPEEIRKALESLGITHNTTVILYGRFSNPDNNDPFPGSSAGQLAAMRCAFIMMYAGVKDVRVLNGGLQSWLDNGYFTTQEDTKKHPVTDFGAVIPSCPEYAVDIPEAKIILQSSDKNLVSVRSWSEFIGEASGYNYIEKKGRIPGAVFGNCGSDAYHMENYRNLDHTAREFHEIENMLAEVGVTPDKYNAFYCGTGWRASEAFLNVWLMGWPRVSVFDGGWFEWSNDDNNQIETGVPE
jgi:thiosulfate/3-mercaptopyruvate sulfurtransferase